ncbi:hypothetical protein OAI26_03005 [Sulfitobacter sp.]|nr:hypothetical protein [Sulfitobacter sp.]
MLSESRAKAIAHVNIARGVPAAVVATAQKPEGLKELRNSKADKLPLLHGVSPRMEKMPHNP